MKSFRKSIPGLLAILTISFLGSCSGGEDGGGITDPTPGGGPTSVVDMAVVGGAAGSLDLTWTSPAMEEKAGQNISYELRYTLYVLIDSSADSWATAGTPTDDQESGVLHTHTVTGLSTGQVYAFALRATTDGETWSPFSNLVVGTAAEVWDTTGPDAIDDLTFWSANSDSITVIWSPAGDDGVQGEATSYEIRYAETVFSESGWDAATVATGEIITQAHSGLLKTTVTDLLEGQTYHFAVRAVDDVGNQSGLSDVLAIATGQGRTYYIKVNGTGDLPTIEAAVNLASEDDIILVGPGRYTWANQGTGDFYGLILIGRDHTGFTLISEEGAAATILDAEGRGGVIHIQGYNHITIDGFTITRGSNLGTEQGEMYAGGGIASHLGSPYIRNCIIKNNDATEGGGLWLGSTGQPHLENCVIENNTATQGGGIAMMNDALHMQITRCTIRNNIAYDAGGALRANNTFFTLEDCVLSGNTAGTKGGGISVLGLHDGCVITGCTIVDNEAVLGSAIRVYGNSTLNVDHCIIAFNREGSAYSQQLEGGLIMGCSNVYGNIEGDISPSEYTDVGGNFTADPLFCNLTDFTLDSGSPCAPDNHPDGESCGLVGALPVACDSVK